MPQMPPLLRDKDTLGAKFLNTWFTALWRLANSAVLTVKDGTPLTLRRTAKGTEIGLALPEYTYGVVTQTIQPRSGESPGTGYAQPYLFNGVKFVPVGNPIKVWNKSKQTSTPLTPGWRITWNYINGFPFIDWGDCTTG